MNFAKTRLSDVFLSHGLDMDESIWGTINNLKNNNNVRWLFSDIPDRPVKWCVIENTDEELFLYFTKKSIQGNSPKPVPPSKLFSIDELSDLMEIDLSDHVAEYVQSGYKGKVLGPLDADQAHAIIKLVYTKNLAIELSNNAQFVAREAGFPIMPPPAAK